jgi:hypothetical protein
MAQTKKTGTVQKYNALLGTIGTIAFFVGFVVALAAGVFLPNNGLMILILVVVGIIIGLLNITAKEVVAFLTAAIALVVAGTTGFKPLNSIIPGLGNILDNIVNYIANLMVPAAVINAVKVVYRVAKPGEEE